MLSTGMSLAIEGEASRPKVKQADEAALIRQAQAGDCPAFEELVRRFDHQVLRLAMNLMRRPEDARDIYQEALDRKSTRLNSSHIQKSRMPSSA